MPLLEEPSVALLVACKAGDQQAFREIFRNFRSYAYNLIYKVTGPNADHEDLVQEAFFQVYLSLRTFKGGSTFKTWFHRIVLNTCSAHWRSQTAEKRISSKNTVRWEDLPGEPAAAEMRVDHAHALKQTVQQALATLDEKLRVPLVLHIYSEMDVLTISEILEIPEGTVKSRLFSARQQIRAFLDQR